MNESLPPETEAKQAYKIYPGEYPVVVIENLGYSRKAELNLNWVVEQGDLRDQIEQIVWIEHILTHPGKFDVLITTQQSWHLLSVYSFPFEGLRAIGEYDIPEIVIKALISRCEEAQQIVLGD